MPSGLRNVPETLDKLVSAQPDAVVMIKGMAKNAWGPHAGKIPLIVSSMLFTVDDRVIEQVADPEEVIRLGGDAIAVAIGVHGPQEGRYLKVLADTVRSAEKFGLPVVAHIYPRDFSGQPKIVNDPENIHWAVRCGMECGADVIKVPFTGEADCFAEIIRSSTVPIVAAGGPKAETVEDALEMTRQVMRAGARGTTIGRNVWGAPDPLNAAVKFKAIVHGGVQSVA